MDECIYIYIYIFLRNGSRIVEVEELDVRSSKNCASVRFLLEVSEVFPVNCLIKVITIAPTVTWPRVWNAFVWGAVEEFVPPRRIRGRTHRQGRRIAVSLCTNTLRHYWRLNKVFLSMYTKQSNPQKIRIKVLVHVQGTGVSNTSRLVKSLQKFRGTSPQEAVVIVRKFT